MSRNYPVHVINFTACVKRGFVEEVANNIAEKLFRRRVTPTTPGVLRASRGQRL